LNQKLQATISITIVQDAMDPVSGYSSQNSMFKIVSIAKKINKLRYFKKIIFSPQRSQHNDTN
jgi:hypothetical protein